MNAILRLWMDVILLLTLQRNVGHRPSMDGNAERFSRPEGEASRYNERSNWLAD